jgi:segregation and condensation protein B
MSAQPSLDPIVATGSGSVMEPGSQDEEREDRSLLPPLDVDDTTLEAGLEGILFIADDALAVTVLAETLGVDADRIAAAISRLAVRYAASEGGISLVEVAGGWRLLSADAARPVLERWLIGARQGRLTQAALETLAVIAYRQPIGRVTIGEVRGVNPDGALRSLVARGLVVEVGREDGPGQAVLFGTTAQFLMRMGLRSLADLPPLPPYLPDGPAPDEPDASGLVELRRRLREGSQRLGEERPEGRFAGAGALIGRADDDDDEERMAAPTTVRPRDDVAIGELSERLEQAARSAMGRLREVAAAQAAAEPVDPADAHDVSDAVRDTAAHADRESDEHIADGGRDE